jgi:hypothetical protein
MVYFKQVLTMQQTFSIFGHRFGGLSRHIVFWQQTRRLALRTRALRGTYG